MDYSSILGKWASPHWLGRCSLAGIHPRQYGTGLECVSLHTRACTDLLIQDRKCRRRREGGIYSVWAENQQLMSGSVFGKSFPRLKSRLYEWPVGASVWNHAGRGLSSPWRPAKELCLRKYYSPGFSVNVFLLSLTCPVRCYGVAKGTQMPDFKPRQGDKQNAEIQKGKM